MRKVTMTRPQFLTKFFTSELLETDLQKMFPMHYGKLYCCYNMLIANDFSAEDILAGTVDAEDGTITLHIRKAKLGKKLKEQYHKTIQSVGKTFYHTKIKLRGELIVFYMRENDMDEDNEEEDEE